MTGSDQTSGNGRKSRAGIFILLIFLVLLAAALAGASWFYHRYRVFCEKYEDRFLPGTRINKINAEGLTVGEVEKMIEDSIDSYSLTFLFGDGKKEVVTDTDIGYHYVSDGSVQKMMDSQDIDSFLRSCIRTKKIPENVCTVRTDTEYDASLLTEIVCAFPELETPDPTEPVDAAMTYADGIFTVTPETDGSETKVDKEPVLEAAVRAVDSLQTEVDVTGLPDVFTEKKIKAKVRGRNLQKEADVLNRYLAGSVTYTLPGGVEQTLDYTTTFSWLSVSDDGRYSVNKEIWKQKAAEYVAGLAASVNSVGRDRSFNATGIGTITLHDYEGYGTYGNTLDQETETSRLVETLSSGGSETRQPVLSSWETADFNDGLGSSYVELDLSRQHMWIYSNGIPVLETDIVSGLMDEECHTPEGIYMVYAKERDTYLLGTPDPVTDQPEYRVPVHIWMPFIKELQIGLHDAGWRSEFGGTIYVWDGSNGCINCPADRIDEIADAVTWEMPVIVYYSDGMVLHG